MSKMTISDFLSVFIVGLQVVITGNLISSQTGRGTLVLLTCGVAIIHVILFLRRNEDLIYALPLGIGAALLASVVDYLNLIGVQLPAKGGIYFPINDAKGLVYALFSLAIAGVVLSGIHYLRKFK